MLILMRHGQSVWNQLNRFTGWVDVPLSPQGIQEAKEAGEKMKGIQLDCVYTSVLNRAIDTALIALSSFEGITPVLQHPAADLMEERGKIYEKELLNELLFVKTAWQLNERYYGELQGLNKKETIKKYGEEQVQIWRRSYSTPPPGGESLEDTAKRTLPYFQEEILPLIQEKKTVLVSAHGNSLRSIIMSLENLSEEEVVKLEIPTGTPMVYELSHGSWRKKEL